MNGNICITKNKMKKNVSKKLEWDFNVPDNKNDILKIASLNADGFITDCEIKDDEITAKVRITANILYIPDVPEDSEPKLSSLETSENFVIKADIPGNMTYDFEDVQFFVRNCSPELINSRKAGVRVNAGLCITLIKNREIGIKMPEDIPVETKTKTVCAVHIPVQLSEKISFSHSFTIPSGKPDIREMLRCCARIKNKEVKAVTGKAVFKGNLEVKILYVSTQNTVECFESKIPFTEIADAKGLTEDMEMMLSACTKDVCVKIYSNDDGKNRNIDVNGFMLFGLTAFKRNEAQIVCDAFCPEYKDECVCEEINYSDISNCLRDAYTLKENITFSDGDLLEICDVSDEIINKEAVLENGKVNIVSDIIYDIVYKSSNGIKCERKTVTFEFVQDAPKSRKYDTVDISCEIAGSSFMITSSNSVEIRSNILFETRLSKEECIEAVTEIKADKSKKNDTGRAPIVTYFPNEREELFNIAKKYRTTVEALKEVNSLKDDYAEPGAFLIIE